MYINNIVEYVCFAAKYLPNSCFAKLSFNYIFIHKLLKPEKLSEICSKSESMKIVDIDNWHRKEHFEFFSNMASPYFGFTTEVDCTKAYDTAKKKGYSFFAYYYHKSMVAVNSR